MCGVRMLCHVGKANDLTWRRRLAGLALTGAGLPATAATTENDNLLPPLLQFTLNRNNDDENWECGCPSLGPATRHVGQYITRSSNDDCSLKLPDAETVVRVAMLRVARPRAYGGEQLLLVHQRRYACVEHAATTDVLMASVRTGIGRVLRPS